MDLFLLNIGVTLADEFVWTAIDLLVIEVTCDFDETFANGCSLADKIDNEIDMTLVDACGLCCVGSELFTNDVDIQQTIRLDVQAVKDIHPSSRSYSWALLCLKGYHALQLYHVAHDLWNQGQRELALALENRISEVFFVDMHSGHFDACRIR
ncbi:hypothetical protein SUGI_0311470 [Cryptomeria japonica]|nr:hypothetical protein SUGI_0311470 [Cryptomeria japonica]